MKELINPRRVDIYFTHRCNLSCPFCYYRSFQKERRADLPLAEWERFIDELASLKVIHIGIYGGEPLIRSDFRPFVRSIVRNRMRFNLISNGTLLTEDVAAFLSETGRCDYVQISIDGLEEEHDRVRGKGNWKKALRALELLEKHSIEARVNMVATRHNRKTVAEAAEFLLETSKIERLRINTVSSRNGVSLPDETGLLDHAEMAELIRGLLPLEQKYHQVIDRSAPLLLYRTIIKPREPTGESPCQICSGLWKGLAVRADGAVLPCSPVEHNVLGWINRDRIQDIWRNSSMLASFRQEVLAGRPLHEEKCASCCYQWHCRQACPANRTGLFYCRLELGKLLGVV